MTNKTNKISRPRRGPADPKKGAVLLIAILVSSVALAVGFGVYNRTYKELVFASFWKQTQIAFSAADSGLECSMYWDTHPPASPAQATCFGGSSFAWSTSTSPFVLPANMSVSGGCVNVTITRAGVSPVVTTITSRGYNTCDPTNPRRVERGLVASYQYL